MRFLRVFLPFILAFIAGCQHAQQGRSISTGRHTGVHRIVSFAPSITETLFALGKGDEIVGVTRYCNFPPAARKISRVGGYTDPNFEMILGLKPDIVLALNEHGPLREFLAKNHIAFQVVQNESLNEIIASFRLIGGLSGAAARGDSLADSLKRELSRGMDPPVGRQPAVLVCAGRDAPGSGRIGRVFAAGAATFYTDLLRAAGCRNACADTRFAYPELSAEGIVRLQPDIVIDVMPSVSPVSMDRAAADWSSMPLLPAVRTKCVYCLSGDYATIPGPRIIQLYRDIKKIVFDARGKIR